MQTWNHINIKKDLIEVLIFLVFVVLYVFFKKEISGKYYFIIPAIILCGLSLRWDYRTDKRVLKTYGIRTDNLKEAALRSAAFFGPMAIAILAIFPFTDNPKPPPYFYFTIFLYPLWGLAQQFMFQSFFHSRLLKLGFAPWSIFICALVFTCAHWNSEKLLIFAFIGGLFFSYSFYRCPNILPLGIAHGILGAMVYYLLLGKDPLRHFFNG
jgi:membrane protease YdiL (CAAX protease family)